MNLRKQAGHFFQYFLIKKLLYNLFKPNAFLLNTFFEKLNLKWSFVAILVLVKAFKKCLKVLQPGE